MTALLLLAFIRAASAGCPTPLTSADLIASIDDAKAAYSKLDVTGFRAAMAQVHTSLPCTADELGPHVAAEVHRFEGLLGFLDRATDRSLTAFAAARSIEPNYRFPESVVPTGNPVLEDYDEIDPDSGQTLKVGEPVSGRILFDGVQVAERPRNFPTLIQLIDEDGAVTNTAYLWPGEALPSYPAKEVTVGVVPPPAPPNARQIGKVPPSPQPGGPTAGHVKPLGSASPAPMKVRDGPNTGLMAGAGVTAALAAVLYGGAYAVHQKYDNPDTSIESLDGLRTANNSLIVASGASVALALSLGTSAFVVARF